MLFSHRGETFSASKESTAGRSSEPEHKEAVSSVLVRSLKYPFWHLMSVRQAVVIVEHKDGGHYAGSHHEHYGVEIGG